MFIMHVNFTTFGDICMVNIGRSSLQPLCYLYLFQWSNEIGGWHCYDLINNEIQT